MAFYILETGFVSFATKKRNKMMGNLLRNNEYVEGVKIRKIMVNANAQKNHSICNQMRRGLLGWS